MGTSEIIIGLVWVFIKNTVLYFSEKGGRKLSFYTFIFWIITSFAVINTGIYGFRVSLNAFLLLVPLKNIPLWVYSVVPYGIDLATNFFIKRKNFPKDIIGIFNYDIFRSFLFFFLILAVSLVFSLSFWIGIIFANIFHLNIAGYQY